MATDDDVIAKIFGKMDVDNSGSICEAELSAAFLGFDRDGELCRPTCDRRFNYSVITVEK